MDIAPPIPWGATIDPLNLGAQLGSFPRGLGKVVPKFRVYGNVTLD